VPALHRGALKVICNFLGSALKERNKHIPIKERQTKTLVSQSEDPIVNNTVRVGGILEGYELGAMS
jgi:hypothetical protein